MQQQGRVSSSLHENVMAIVALKDILLSSLGPNARSKLIVTPQKRVVVSQDGAFILKQLSVQQPAAKLLVESVLSLDRLIGDGTTSTALIACSLIENGYMKHAKEGFPIVNILNGYDTCLEIIKSEILKKVVVKLDDEMEMLIKSVVNCALSSKISVHINGNYLTDLLTASIKSVMKDDYYFNRDDIKLIQIPGLFGKVECLPKTLILSQLSTTNVEELEMKRAEEQPHYYKLLVIKNSLHRQRTKTKHYAILDTVESLEKWKIDEEMVFKEMAECIRDFGAHIVLCSGNVHDLVSHYLQNFGILCLANAGNEVCDFACKTFNIRHLQSIEELQCDFEYFKVLDDSDHHYLGMVESVHTFQASGGVNCSNAKCTMIKAAPIEDSVKTTCTAIIRASTSEQCEEFVRHAQDALFTAMVTFEEIRARKLTATNIDEDDSSIFLTGGGSFEIFTMWNLEEIYMNSSSSKNEGVSFSSLDHSGIDAFIKSLRIVPETLCLNSNLPIERTLQSIAKRQKSTNSPHLGIPARQVVNLQQLEDLISATATTIDKNNNEEDMLKLRVFDSVFTKMAILENAIEIAKSILRVSENLVLVLDNK